MMEMVEEKKLLGSSYSRQSLAVRFQAVDENGETTQKVYLRYLNTQKTRKLN